MGEIAAGLAVEAAKAITKVVAGSAFEEMKLVWGFKDQLENLKKKFRYIEALMNDIEMGKHAQNSNLVNLWLEDVKDVASSAENLLDDHQYEMLRRKIEFKTNRPSFKKKCHNYVKPSTNPIVFRIRMTHRVNHILSELDELEKRAANIGLRQVKLARDAVSPPNARHMDHMESLSQARKHAAATGSDFIGRVHDREKLLQKILNPSTKEDGLSIIAIVGIGGLGKTTLARQLFEHEKIIEQFARKKVWICVSEDFHVDKILKEMAESLETEKRHLKNIDAIIEELKKVLEGKKFFLVLDDVWNDNKELWNSLTTRLRNIGGLTGSVILITTRSHKVASKACASYSHDLKGLSEDEGWELLKQQCFKETMPHDSSFDDVGKRIVAQKCGGVPLAIKSIGGLLQSQQHKSDWESIESSEQWYFKADDNNYIMPSLLLSYNHIVRVYVKQCFTNCAIFPKDSLIKKEQIIALWLAEGLLHEESETSSLFATHQEIIGEDYINELVKYSFLQEENVRGQIRYKMHDLVHDLASYVSRKDLLVLKSRDRVKHGNYSQCRHLVLKFGKDELVPDYLTEEKMRRLRTISLWHEMPRWNSLLCARYVRTLVMTNAGLTEVPPVILQLVHLRYLDLSKNHKIKELPELICKLYQLQTLRLWKCFGIKELPRELHKLENLRHIETSECVFASSGLQNLTSLQTLPFALKLGSEEGWTIDELGPLDQVKGDVRIKGLEHVKNNEQARKAEIGRKDNISRLELWWDESDEGNNDEDVLGGLEPHPYIQSILIEEFKGESFPGWMKQATQLSHLRVLLLRSCKVGQLPSLGQLPNLTILELYRFDEVECIGDEFYGNSNNVGDRKVLFPALKELVIIQFKSLTSWMPPCVAVGTSVLPKLELIDVRECRVLETVPALQLESLKEAQIYEIGGNQILDVIKGSPSLNMLQIEGVHEMVSLPKELSNYISLQTLKIMDFEKVEWIPGGMISLKRLWVWDCPSLGSIEEGVLHGLSSLRVLDISRCVGLKRVPKNLEDCTSLEELIIRECPLIECPEEEAVPDIGKLQGLTSLALDEAGGLMAYSPRWIPQLHRLQYLGIGGHRGGEAWDMSLTSTLPSLTRLYLRNFPNMKPLLVPTLLPPSLRELEIEGFEEMEALPDWIGDLSSLQRLRLWDCNKLKYLPSQGAVLRLTRLTELHIEQCPELSEGCDQHNNGPEWPKISRIPKIKIILQECSRLI